MGEGDWANMAGVKSRGFSLASEKKKSGFFFHFVGACLVEFLSVLFFRDNEPHEFDSEICTCVVNCYRDVLGTALDSTVGP